MWIEIVAIRSLTVFITSQPARAVWIEIQIVDKQARSYGVTACEGCVD